MRIHAVFAGILVVAVSSLAPAQSTLHTKVFTGTPEGYSVTSTLIYGDKDAILVDPQFLLSEAHKVAAMILESKKNLTTVYSTHGHPDHYFGLAVMKSAFPGARLVALPSVVTGIKNGWEARYKFWLPTYGNNLPSTGPILPEELQGTTLTLEGQELQLVGGVQGDAPNNSFVWIPSIRTVVAGDIVFSGVHFGVPSGNNRTEWLKTLDRIAAFNPAVIIPGHQVAGAKNDLSAIEFMKKYMQDWDRTVASSKNADQLRAEMKKRYPNLGMEQLLNNGAQAAFPPKPVAQASLNGFTPVTKEMLANPGPDDWLMYSRMYDAQRFSLLKQITQQNVGQLRQVFKKELGMGVNTSRCSREKDC